MNNNNRGRAWRRDRGPHVRRVRIGFFYLLLLEELYVGVPRLHSVRGYDSYVELRRPTAVR